MATVAGPVRADTVAGTRAVIVDDEG